MFANDTTIVIRAGLPIIVGIPQNDDAIDLGDGPITVGLLVNATIFPGVTFEVASGIAQRA